MYYVDAYMQLKSYLVNIEVLCLVMVKSTQWLGTYLLKCLNKNVQDFQVWTCKYCPSKSKMLPSEADLGCCP